MRVCVMCQLPRPGRYSTQDSNRTVYTVFCTVQGNTKRSATLHPIQQYTPLHCDSGRYFLADSAIFIVHHTASCIQASSFQSQDLSSISASNATTQKNHEFCFMPSCDRLYSFHLYFSTPSFRSQKARLCPKQLFVSHTNHLVIIFDIHSSLHVFVYSLVDIFSSITLCFFMINILAGQT